MILHSILPPASTFTNNTAVGFGGGVVGTSDSMFNVTNSTFTNNSATGGGGVVATSDSMFNVTSSTFTNNSAVGSGGGVIVASDSSLYI